jgi:aspartyl-tRNA(Asn)/glutamyl-tRNA(Gln) amidotransferase subunit A
MPRLNLASITEVRRRISSNEISTKEYVVQCIENIKNISGEGAKAFLYIAQDEAIATAHSQDILLEKGLQIGPLSGVTVSIKDLFDIAGQVTASGSNVLRNNSPATEDSEVVSRIRRAGGIVVGRTNMTEFAYSGLGLNPHFGTPLNPYDRSNGRIPGGSTSGGAISVTDQMALIAIGSDTGGSCRIPAALCGIVGFKPTASRYSMAGVLPLSRSLDSVGILASSVQCCQIIDGVLFDGSKGDNFEVPISRINIGIVDNVVLDGMDGDVKKNYLRTIEILEKSGANLRTINSKVFERVIQLQGQPKIVSAEANSEYENILALKGEEVDPRVSSRIVKGKEISSAVYIKTLVERKLLIQAWRQEFSNDDVWVMPTVPVIAPLLNDLSSDEEYFKYNSLMLRNPGLINFLDGCALSIPNHFAEEPPTGIMLASPGSDDETLLRCGLAVEKMLSSLRS